MAKKGKKPGEFQAARARHLNRQSNVDGMKLLREGDCADLMLFGKDGFALYTVDPKHPHFDSWGDPFEGEIEIGRRAVVRFGDRLCIASLEVKNDGKILATSEQDSNPSRYINQEEIIGWLSVDWRAI